MDNRYKEVFFNVYCPKCEHFEKKECEPPCDECLEEGTNEYSHKPVNFKEAENDKTSR